MLVCLLLLYETMHALQLCSGRRWCCLGCPALLAAATPAVLCRDGLADAVGGGQLGVITVSEHGSTQLFANKELRRVAEAAGLTLPSVQADKGQVGWG